MTRHCDRERRVPWVMLSYWEANIGAGQIHRSRALFTPLTWQNSLQISDGGAISGSKSAGDWGWHVGQNLVSAGMGLGTPEHELLDQLAYWVQILRLGTILGSFTGFIDSARMKLRCWTGIGISFLGSVENAAPWVKLTLSIWFAFLRGLRVQERSLQDTTHHGAGTVPFLRVCLDSGSRIQQHPVMFPLRLRTPCSFWVSFTSPTIERWSCDRCGWGGSWAGGVVMSVIMWDFWNCVMLRGHSCRSHCEWGIFKEMLAGRRDGAARRGWKRSRIYTK
mgnify:CR=1 FL=1